MLPIHSELAGYSEANPAGYITLLPFAKLTLDRLHNTVALLTGKEIPAGSGVLSASLSAVTWSAPAQAEFATPIAPTFPDQEVDILIPQPFEVTLDIFVSGDPTAVISRVIAEVSDARAHIRAANNVLILEGAEFKSQKRIERHPNADALLQAANIDPLEAARVEGHLAYGVISQAITLTLAQRAELPLSTVFPVVDFGTSIKLRILQGGLAIGIIPTETVSIAKQSHCECQEGPDLDHTDTTIVDTAPANPGVNDKLADVTIGGPVAENKDPLNDFGARFPDAEGIAGLYIPLEFARALTVEAMPSVKIKASDNGTIGFQAEANVGFKNFRVSFDVAGGGILLDIDLDISVTAYCDFEVFKGLRLPIGWAAIMPTRPASLQLGFYPSVGKDGVVKLKSTLRNADMGSYVAVVIGIGTALKFLGVTAWIGFLIDVVLATILSVALPIALKKEIRKYLGTKEWKLLDGLPLSTPNQGWWPSAPFDVAHDSLLASFESRG